jgi:hypothetical protein
MTRRDKKVSLSYSDSRSVMIRSTGILGYRADSRRYSTLFDRCT